MADPSLGRMTLALALPLVANHWKIETKESKRSGENLTQVNMQNHLLHHSRLRLSAPRFDFYLPESAVRGSTHAHLGTIQYERASTVCIAVPKASERASERGHNELPHRIFIFIHASSRHHII